MRLIPALPTLLLLAALDAQHFARADNWGHPMRFELIVGAILADGDIVSDTPDQLERFLARNSISINNKLILNSRGGDLWAGLKMGKIIRAHRLHTSVGGYNQWAHRSFDQMERSTGKERYYAYCISACTLAFLGGAERAMAFDGLYAVHQASMECRDPNKQPADKTQQAAGKPLCPHSMDAFSAAQSMFGDLVEYVQKMGVDPAFVTEMSKADPDGMNILSYDVMLKYKILTRP
jgi:hypothetical protein